jgi:hypothetical protein
LQNNQPRAEFYTNWYAIFLSLIRQIFSAGKPKLIKIEGRVSFGAWTDSLETNLKYSQKFLSNGAQFFDFLKNIFYGIEYISALVQVRAKTFIQIWR